MERIERLLHELKYEVIRGMMEGEIDEHVGMRFYVPTSKTIPNGVVFCEFKTRPMPYFAITPEELTPKLQIIK